MILRALFILSIAFAISCSGDKKKSDTSSSDNTTTEITTPAAPATSTTTPPPAEPPQNAEGVWHFTCPNGCEGGGGAVGPCPKCGATLAHNQAYHGSTSATTAPVTSNPTTQITPPTAEPPQNANGVWHFTCPNGCDGGGGAVGPCTKCGATLAHNQAYHQ